MSAKLSTKKQVFDERFESLYLPFPDVEPSVAELPWAEWSDSSLNAEKWDAGKPVTSKGGAAPQLALFEDPQPFKLPSRLEERVETWKRPNEIFKNISLYNPNNADFILSMASGEGQKVELLSIFIELLQVLQFHSLREGFPVEEENATFVSTTSGQPWKPWHLIYALCKAGKGQTHKPLLCPYGKYVVRLYYMNAWRLIRVDDRIPCDLEGHPMLPQTQVPGELWPIILFKALLKVAALTPHSDYLHMDLPTLSLLTGWLCCFVPARNRSPDETWRCMSAFSIQYSCTPLNPLADKPSGKPGTAAPPEVKRPCFVLATLSILNSLHRVGVTMVRDIPLMRFEKRPPTELWKRVRWVTWAAKKGIWKDEQLMPPYRCLQYISYLGEVIREDLAVSPELEKSLFITPTPWPPQSKDVPNTSPEQWGDFYLIAKYLRHYNLLLKPCVFITKMILSNLPSGKTGQPNTPKAARGPSTSFFLSPNLTLTQNAAPFIFAEHHEGFVICLSLWVCPTEALESKGYLSSDVPPYLQVYRGSLLVERYDWRSARYGPLVAGVKTVGNGVACLFLDAGRHLLRLWLDTDSPFIIRLYSSAEVSVNRGANSRFLMSMESFNAVNYINQVSTAYLILASEFGKPGYHNALRSFYTALRPGNTVLPTYHTHLDGFIQFFVSSLVGLLRELVLSDEDLRTMLGALRSLLVDPSVKYPLPPLSLAVGKAKAPKGPVIVPRTLSEILSREWTQKELTQINIIQKVFRGYSVRLLLKNQTPLRKELKLFSDKLKKIGDLVFSVPKREALVGRLLRDVSLAHPAYFTLFKFHKDLDYTITRSEISGLVEGVAPFKWVPLVRVLLNTHTEEAYPNSFVLSCNLEQLVLVLINNKTMTEEFRLTNMVAPGYYRNSELGYTLLGYGWNESAVKTVHWRLELLSQKHYPAMHPCNTLLSGLLCNKYMIPSLVTTYITANYIPNHRQRIARCLIKILNTTLVTMRFSVSYEKVKFRLMVTEGKKNLLLYSQPAINEEDGVLYEIESEGAVIVPALVLDYQQPPPPTWRGEYYEDVDIYTYFTLDVIVMYDSWPLTCAEWGVVEPLRTGGEMWPESASTTTLLGESESSVKGSARQGNSLAKAAEPPYWCLEVVTDVLDPMPDGREQVQCVEDMSEREAIRKMKIAWEDAMPGRRHHGHELRNAFLRKICMEERSMLLGEGHEHEGEDAFKCDLMLRQMSSFTYLLNNPSPVRHLVSPRVLPTMPSKHLKTKYGQGFGLVPSYMSCADIGCYLDDLGQDKSIYMGKLHQEQRTLLKLGTKRRTILNRYLKFERKKSAELMEEAYEKRSKLLSRLKANAGKEIKAGNKKGK